MPGDKCVATARGGRPSSVGPRLRSLYASVEPSRRWRVSGTPASLGAVDGVRPPSVAGCAPWLSTRSQEDSLVGSFYTERYR